MDYEIPAIQVVGSASKLIQNYVGPDYDGDGTLLSYGAICSLVESE